MTIQCEVLSVRPLAAHTYQIMLKPQQALMYRAGQYLLAVMGEKDKRPFSIANSPLGGRGEKIELHIGAADENPYALEVVKKAQTALMQQSLFEIDAPHGDAWLQDSLPTPRILIAGGTGFSYVHSILEQMILAELNSPIFVYWGARNESQLYQNEAMQTLAAQHTHLTYIPVIEQPDANWQGKVGQVLDAVMDDFISLTAYDIYLAGRFEMAGAAREIFCQERGAQRERIFADAYRFI